MEGVLALDLPAIRDRARPRVYIAIDETVRRQRFVEAYRRRGYGDVEAQALYEERDAEERAVVTASSVYADIAVTGEMESK